MEGVWDTNKYIYSRATVGILLRKFREQGRTVRNVRYARNSSGMIVGSSYDELASVRVPTGSSDYLRYIATNSTGLVRTTLIQESLQCYVYSILGAQANTRWPIIGKGTSSGETQKVFRKLVGDMVVQTDITVGITNLRTAIRSTNVIVNAAINRSIILFPSNMVRLNNPVLGYNNVLLQPDSATSFGVNMKVNYVGAKQDDPPKKQHQGSTPVSHLDTLKGSTKVPGSATKIPHHDIHRTNATAPVPTPVKPSYGGVTAGLVIGSITVFILLRKVR